MSEWEQPYREAFRGSFSGMLRWENLDRLWETLKLQADDGWYIYAVGEPPPERTAGKAELLAFIEEVDKLLRAEHDEDYCGIVYADDVSSPTFVKIFDPHQLGSSCGSSPDGPPLPGWTLSRLRPADLRVPGPLPGNRRRWWRRLFAS
jgi:hypothetical protein